MTARRLLAGLRWTAVIGFVVLWALALRPQTLAGPAAWVLVSGNSMRPSIADGDLVLAHSAREYRPGDIVAYRVPEGDVGAGAVVLHRIVGGSARAGFTTQGDNRVRIDVWRPTADEIEGRLVFAVPHAGKLLALVRTPLILAGLAALSAALIVPVRRPLPPERPPRAAGAARPRAARFRGGAGPRTRTRDGG